MTFRKVFCGKMCVKMKSFCFTIDDNIRLFKEITERGYNSIFEHPYLAMLHRLHDKFGLKIQLNLFYATENFDLSQMSDCYKSEWSAVSDWLKMSFHSHHENVSPYESSGYSEVFDDCKAVNREILRFASRNCLADTTTIHFCKTTKDGLLALKDNGVRGLLGLFGDDDNPRTSYEISEDKASRIRNGEIVCIDDITFASIDMVVNTVRIEEITALLSKLLSRSTLRIMIHEQYFYEDYQLYQPDFEEKLTLAFKLLSESGYQSRFFEELI